MRPILVTGASGTLGRAVVRRLRSADRTARMLSRRPRPAAECGRDAWVTGDLRSGEGIDTAVTGVDAIIHCATAIGRGDVAAARNLIEAAERAGGPHLIYISIVGVDRVPFGYYRAKLEVEGLIERSGLPWTTLRTTQFHDLIARMSAAQRRLPVTLTLAGVRFQPIDAGEVADRLVELSAGPPAGRVPDMGGPQVRTARDLTRAYLRAVGRRRLVLPLRLPGATFRGYRRGGHLAPAHAVGRVTFEEFLAERIAPAARTGTGQKREGR